MAKPCSERSESKGIIVQIIVNYYTPQGKVWIYHRGSEHTVDVPDKEIMRELEAEIQRACQRKGKNVLLSKEVT